MIRKAVTGAAGIGGLEVVDQHRNIECRRDDDDQVDVVRFTAHPITEEVKSELIVTYQFYRHGFDVHHASGVLFSAVLRYLKNDRCAMSRTGSRRLFFQLKILIALSALAAMHAYGGAGIATDGSVGSNGNIGVQRTIVGPNAVAGTYLIPQALGSLSGNNVFYSFSKFNVDAGQTAQFTTTTPTVSNVISRVTGGTTSQINGVLKLAAAAGTPAFYFINPAGIVFGANATLNVPGAFHVSTADYIKFTNGERFYADLSKTSTLSSAAPAAFGFLGNTRASIAFDGPWIHTGLSQPISVVAGDISIANDGSVYTFGGDIRVVAVGGGAQEVDLVGTLPAAAGNLDIQNGGSIFSYSSGAIDGGKIAVSAGRLTIQSDALSDDNTGIFGVTNPGTGNAGSVKVSAQTISINALESGFFTGIFGQAWRGSGNAGAIDVSVSGLLSLDSGGQISADTYTSGNAGTVKVSAGSVSLNDQGRVWYTTGIFSQTLSRVSNAGKAGAVDVSVSGVLSLTNGAQITTDTDSSGNAGIVNVGAGSMMIDGSGSGVFSQTQMGSGGQGGSINVAVGGALALTNAGEIGANTYSSGNAGTIKVSGNSIFLGNGAEISSSTLSSGNAGAVNVNAVSITADGPASGIVSVAGSSSSGNAGRVSAAATSSMVLTRGGQITADTYSSGNAGDVNVSSGRMMIDGSASGIFGQTWSGTGRAGNVTVGVAGALALTNGGQIAANNNATGVSGSVTVSAESIDISGGSSGVFSQTSRGVGDAGSVDVLASGAISLTSGGQIATDTSAAGNAGSVKIGAGSIVVNGPMSGVFSRGEAGNAGNLNVAVAGALSVVNGGALSSSSASSGNAGTININAGSILIDSLGHIVSSAQAGDAGSIDITTAQALSLINGGQIAAYSGSGGHGGTLKITAGSILVDGLENPARPTGLLTAGKASSVDVSATGDISLQNGGQIALGTVSTGDADALKVSAGNLSIASQSNVATGIFSQATSGSGGNAGSVAITVGGRLSVGNGGVISSTTESSGNAGPVVVSAGSIAIDGQASGNVAGIFSQTEPGSSGHAGSVNVSTGALSVINGSIGSDTYGAGDAGSVKVSADSIVVANGGGISSGTFSSGNAGSVAVSANRIGIDGKASGIATGIFSQAEQGSSGNAGSINIAATGVLSIVQGGVVTSSANATGNAGTVTVGASSITIDGQASSIPTGILSQTAGMAGPAGSIEVSTAGVLSILGGGEISSSSRSAANAGAVTVRAGSIAIDGQGSQQATGIASQAVSGSTGNAGGIDVSTTGGLSIDHGGGISSSSFSVGNAGTVKVSAASIAIDNFGGIFSNAKSDSGSAGSVTVSTLGALSIRNGGTISSDTYATGNAGVVSVSADSLVLASGGAISSSTASAGNAGVVRVSAGSVSIDNQTSSLQTGIFCNAEFGKGDAGSIDLAVTGALSVVNGGEISSNTFSSGNAGSIKISASSILIDSQTSRTATGILSQAEPGSGGNAGNVDVTASGALTIANYGGEIDSSTFGAGRAGSITVRAGSIAITGGGSNGKTGITTQAAVGSTGDAGSVFVSTTGALSILGGGVISSSTAASGNGGSVTVNADALRVDGDMSKISAAAAAGSSGQTGFVNVTANDLTLTNGSQISITNDATVLNPSMLAPASLLVTAPRIALLNSPNAITAQSTGNVAAGSIYIGARDKLYLDPSGISTSANEGNGGAITITTGLLWLEDAWVTTSVKGLKNGNGGNINVFANTLIMKSGFIQANTAAANASGGLVSITTQTLTPSGNSLFLGGNTIYNFLPGIFGYNVIQAAAPSGVTGVVQISSPIWDVSASLIGLDTRKLKGGQIARHLCEYAGGSSLVSVGRGGLPWGASDFLSSGLFSGENLVSQPSAESEVPKGLTTLLAPCLAVR